MRRAIHRLLVWWLRETTAHVAPNCGRWSGYHDDDLPMICARREGHLGPWHFDSINGYVWRSGEEPQALADVRLSTLQSLARSLGAHLTVDVVHPAPATFDVDAWHRNRDAWGELLVLEQRLTDATDIAPDALTFPGADGSSTFQGRPIIDGARQGLVFYIKEPST